MKILDGKKVRDARAGELEAELKRLKVKPKLVIVQVGNDESSNIYIRQKKLLGEKIGFEVELVQFLDDAKEVEIVEKIKLLNADKKVNGIIVQSPLPSGLTWYSIVSEIIPIKDVDGVSPENIKNLSENNGLGLIPATAKGILSLLDFYNIKVKGKKVAVMGKSILVGNPIAVLMKNNGADVSVCDSKTVDPEKITRKSDILIVAIGKPEYVGADFANISMDGKSEQVIVDVGISSVMAPDGTKKVRGDVDFDSVKDIVSAISPVPGGVGPMTVISLFENLLIAYKRQNGLK